MLPNPVRAWRIWSERNIDIAALPFILVFVVIAMTIATSGRFISFANFSGISSQLPELGLLSLAMMITMLSGGINLSIISTANFSGVIMALMLKHLLPMDASGFFTFIFIVGTIIAGLIISVILGFFNGILIAYVEIPAVLATLGTMILYEGLTLAITKGFVISDFTEMFLAIGSGKIVGIPYILIVFIVVAIALSIVYRRRPFGKYLYMIGNNITATGFSAIDTKKVLLKTYVISSFLCGIAAVIMVSRFNSANARQGVSLLLLTVVISVLGGTDPFGGSGKVFGMVLALIILQLLNSGLNLMGISSFVTLSLWGILLVLVIAYRFYRSKKWGRNRMARLEN